MNYRTLGMDNQHAYKLCVGCCYVKNCVRVEDVELWLGSLTNLT